MYLRKENLAGGRGFVCSWGECSLVIATMPHPLCWFCFFRCATENREKIEDEIAAFMGTEEAISYSDSATTISSAIPAFAKKGDLTIVDQVTMDAHSEGRRYLIPPASYIDKCIVYTRYFCRTIVIDI